ncbi:MAG: hypothetical protein P0Y48_12885 [Candidatus Microbacterium phytovorans]|uniref:Histidine kinase/HSP90-like ATPase domain-containing protein n=1 Tax=Candidatus Microbacterium phytovorans TaxID=3121374 RepID=A0AAJ6B3R5_9MICO|nr:ATP-binding protein [Microbacterium sp.]WEK13339.1 MAG: hypothetical protein P0Y48_12885 [Microbacterium sp.]
MKTNTPSSPDVDRRLGMMVAAGTPFIILGLVGPSAAAQVGHFDTWWEVLARIPVVATVALALFGWFLPVTAARPFWIGIPAATVLAQLLSFAAYAGPTPPVSPWIWTLEPATAAYLAVALRPIAAMGATVFSAVCVALSAWVFLGYVPTDVAADTPLQLANVLFCALFIAMRGRLRQLHDSELSARMAEERNARAAALSRERATFTELVHDEVLSVLSAALLFRGQTPAELRSEARYALTAIGAAPDGAADTGPHAVGGGGLVTSRDAAHLITERLHRTMPDLPLHVSIASPDTSPAFPHAVIAALSDAGAEAVRNAKRHSGSEHIRAALWIAASTVTLTIADDGRGFDPSVAAQGRFGLAQSITGRMLRVGGTAAIRSAPGEGTAVVLTWTP